MAKNAKTTTRVATRQPKAPEHTIPPPQIRTMSLDKAKKLIRKTSAHHSELFRRLSE